MEPGMLGCGVWIIRLLSLMIEVSANRSIPGVLLTEDEDVNCESATEGMTHLITKFIQCYESIIFL